MTTSVKRIIAITTVGLQDGTVDVTPLFEGTCTIILPPPPPIEFYGGYEAFTFELWVIQFPFKFKASPIQKYDRKHNPNEWLHIYTTVVQAACNYNRVMANYLLTTLDGPARS